MGLRELILRKPKQSNKEETVLEHDNTQPTEIDLGPHAREKQMPRWLVRVLKSGDTVSSRGVIDLAGTRTSMNLKVVETPFLIPALARLSQSDTKVKKVHYCSPHVHYVTKLRREGSFCGYRNIQMLISYIQHTEASGHEHFDQQPLPSIFELQQMIERAWDKGFNASGREEIGNLYMTRKFIGTSEAEALLLSLNIPVLTRAFLPTTEKSAYDILLEYVSHYFEFDVSAEASKQVVTTDRPPLFLQRRGHSMTIVGVEDDISGSRNLVVFDPKYKPSAELRRVALGQEYTRGPAKVLRAHRYGKDRLGKYDAFEIVQLSG